MKTFITHIKPGSVFLIDGIGASISALMLAIVLVMLEPWIGMPGNILFVLASFPVLFAIYDAWCYVNAGTRWRVFLRIIAIANLIYCLISILFFVQHLEMLTMLGKAYFTGEILIVGLLACLELWKTKLQHSPDAT